MDSHRKLFYRRLMIFFSHAMILYISIIALGIIIQLGSSKILLEEQLSGNFESEIDSIHHVYQIVQLNIEHDSLVEEMDRLRVHMKYDSSYLIQSQYYTAKKDAELKNLELEKLKELKSKNINKEFPITNLSFSQIILWILMAVPVFTSLKILIRLISQRIDNQSGLITPNEVADLITYSLGPILFILIFF